MLIGYARVSTLSQSTDIQKDALRKAGCIRVYAEKVSGKSRDDRGELATILDYIREGDTLVVTKLDCLGRSTRDVLNIIKELHDRGAYLQVLEIFLDTRGPMGEPMITILGVVAQMERNFIRERQRDGIERAKQAGVYKGRKAKLDRAQMAAMAAEGAGATEIAQAFKCSRGMVYKALKGSPSDPNPPS